MSAKIPTDPTREDFAKVLPLFDKDKTESIPLANLKQIVRELGEIMTGDDLAELIKHADADRDGEVRETMTEEVCAEKTQHADSEGDGEVLETMTEDDHAKIIEHVDSNGDEEMKIIIK